MGILKIELEVPEFKEAIELSLILKKDGEVIASSSSLDKDSEKPIWKQDMPLGPGTLYNPHEPSPYESPVWKQTPMPEPGKIGDSPKPNRFGDTPEPSKFIVSDDPTQKGPYCSTTTTGGFVPTQKSSGGNFMNINIDDL